MSIFGNENAKYVFKYYPGRGYRLCKLDSMGRIESFVDDYRDYAKVLKENPGLKRTYLSTDPKDLKQMISALKTLKLHQYSYSYMLKVAMLMGTTVDSIEKLVSQKEKLLPSSNENRRFGEGEITMRMLSEPNNKRMSEESGGYYMMSTNKPEYISLEERKKKSKKHKVNRKIKRCKCKK